MNKTELLNKCARSGEERVLLARALDKLELAQNRSVPACTPFLSPGEQASVTDLLNAWGRPRHLFFGGYEGAERAVCAFLPDWQEESDFLADPAAKRRADKPLSQFLFIRIHGIPADVLNDLQNLLPAGDPLQRRLQCLLQTAVLRCEPFLAVYVKQNRTSDAEADFLQATGVALAAM